MVMAVPTPEVPAVMAVPAVTAVPAGPTNGGNGGFLPGGPGALVVPVVRGVRLPAQTQVPSMFQTRHRE